MAGIGPEMFLGGQGPGLRLMDLRFGAREGGITALGLSLGCTTALLMRAFHSVS